MNNIMVDIEKNEFDIITKIIHKFEMEYLKKIGYHKPCDKMCKYCNDQCYDLEEAPVNVINKRVGLSNLIYKSISYNRIKDIIGILGQR